ncbi:nucleoside-diphosphate sugar epimerase/dehydratase [Acetobacter sp. DsW_063]|uniref:polysaccharide biosynthesis protein n=1 Tax=Acetobacter sp. DsW_063 TaxID=1514894 RepID=UPI000A38A734|nr:nucleoside-diphosphate sugar epimerase/dehydratase [Acetobacter sp. DsW_063]OUJ15608.1 nucleotide sugar dehydratase [Acetobacter sp. DsW_063]
MAPQRPEVAPISTRLRPFNRILVNVLLDGTVAALAAPVARWLAAPQEGLLHPLWLLAGGAITLLVSGLPFRMPQQYWRFSGISDLLGIVGASIASAALFTAGLAATGYPLPSPAFPIIYALTLIVMLGGLRAAYRIFNVLGRRGAAQQRVVLVGADQVADLFLRAIARNPGSDVRVTGLIGQGTNQAGRRIHNVPILGHVTEIAALLDGMAQRKALPDSLVVTDPNFRGEGLSRVLDAAEAHGVEVMRAPVLTALTPADRVELRPVALEDLLNRPQVPLDREGMDRMIRDRVVMVTGAGGSIGSELARQIASFGPSRLVLVDNGEYALWRIDVELGEQAHPAARDIVVADVRDAGRIERVFATYRPALVFHAAALKHVPIVESNPCEGLLTNVLGTRIVADAAARHGAQAMVVISTDKAVNPSSLMGASKRAAEMYCQALDIAARTSGRRDAMRCVTVRFGNVLGSTGSVVPLFRRQLERGGPLTVTHPDMRRYFMTVPEAVGLVLQASVRGAIVGLDHEESGTDAMLRDGGIFVLDMGQPVKIVDLARRIIRLAGLRPDEDVAIRFTGLRPGEKLFEELFHGREAPAPTDAPGLLIATPRVVDLRQVSAAVDRIAACAHDGNAAEAIAVLTALVPEFVHNSTGATPTDAGEAASDAAPGTALGRERLVS